MEERVRAQHALPTSGPGAVDSTPMPWSIHAPVPRDSTFKSTPALSFPKEFILLSQQTHSSRESPVAEPGTPKPAELASDSTLWSPQFRAQMLRPGALLANWTLGELISSSQLRRSLLGSPVSEEVRNAVLTQQMPEKLRALLIDDMSALYSQSFAMAGHANQEGPAAPPTMQSMGAHTRSPEWDHSTAQAGVINRQSGSPASSVAEQLSTNATHMNQKLVNVHRVSSLSRISEIGKSSARSETSAASSARTPLPGPQLPAPRATTYKKAPAKPKGGEEDEPPPKRVYKVILKTGPNQTTISQTMDSKSVSGSESSEAAQSNLEDTFDYNRSRSYTSPEPARIVSDIPDTSHSLTTVAAGSGGSSDTHDKQLSNVIDLTDTASDGHLSDSADKLVSGHVSGTMQEAWRRHTLKSSKGNATSSGQNHRKRKRSDRSSRDISQDRSSVGSAQSNRSQPPAAGNSSSGFKRPTAEPGSRVMIGSSENPGISFAMDSRSEAAPDESSYAPAPLHHHAVASGGSVNGTSHQRIDREELGDDTTELDNASSQVSDSPADADTDGTNDPLNDDDKDANMHGVEWETQSDLDNTDTDATESVFDESDTDAMEIDTAETTAISNKTLTKLTKSENHSGLTTSASGRSYWIWQSMPTCGAAIPDGYEFSSLPSYPWICPIRDCRKMFIKSFNLACHWNKRHRRAELNDNLDGTFSIVGLQDLNLVGPMKAVVVSRRPLDPNEPPMRVAQRPGFRPHTWEPDIPPESSSASATPISKPSREPSVKKGVVASHASRGVQLLDGTQSRKSDTTPSQLLATMSKDRISALVDAQKMWKYIQPHIKIHDVVSAIQKNYVWELLQLPRVRWLEWNPVRSGPFTDTRIYDVAAVLIQLTGEPAAVSCDRCVRDRGQFKGCVILSPNAPAHVQAKVRSCANCYYKGGQTLCNFSSKVEAVALPPAAEIQAENEIKAAWLKSLGVRDNAIKPSRMVTLRIPPATAETPDQETLGGKTAVVDSKPLSTSNVDATSGHAIQSIARDLRPRNQPSPKEPIQKRVANLTTPRTSLAAVEQSELLQPELALEMEDWEIAPGRVRDDSGEHAENVAFSTAYLNHTQELSIHSGIGFHNIVLKPGSSHRWEAASDKVRVCSVASGKVRVKLGDQEEFLIGPHGMFKVLGNTVCTVQNRLYIDATVHVCVVDET